jgi:hypothetical protein
MDMRAKQRSPFDSIDVRRLGRSEWRISDASDLERVLGFIERQASDRFEIVLMSDPVRWAYVESFESALLAFGDSGRFGGELLSHRVTSLGRQPRSQRTGTRRSAHIPHRRSSWVDQGHESGII